MLSVRWKVILSAPDCQVADSGDALHVWRPHSRAGGGFVILVYLGIQSATSEQGAHLRNHKSKDTKGYQVHIWRRRGRLSSESFQARLEKSAYLSEI